MHRGSSMQDGDAFGVDQRAAQDLTAEHAQIGPSGV
jgi:hypothetical protein